MAYSCRSANGLAGGGRGGLVRGLPTRGTELMQVPGKVVAMPQPKAQPSETDLLLALGAMHSLGRFDKKPEVTFPAGPGQGLGKGLGKG